MVTDRRKTTRPRPTHSIKPGPWRRRPAAKPRCRRSSSGASRQTGPPWRNAAPWPGANATPCA
eukprot:7880952-Lingulodinium_polyedra.AAC.1